MTERAKPLVQREELDRRTLRKLNPVSNGHTSIVYHTKSGQLVLANGRLTAAEIWLGTPRAVYTVDMTSHHDSFEVSLPTKEEAFAFTAVVNSTWRISDPVAAIKNGLDDATNMVRPFLEKRLRELTRLFPAEKSDAAEQEIWHHFGDQPNEVNDYLIVTRCIVKLSLDKGTQQHIAQRTYVQRQAERREQEHTAKLEKIRLSENEEVLSHELERQRTAHRQALEAMQQQHELELKGQRMQIYADALRADDVNLLAMRLAGHGDDVNDVINLIMQQRRLEFEGANAVLNSLLEANLVNRKDVASIMARASNVVVDQLRGRTPMGIGAADDAKPARPPLVTSSDGDDIDDED